MTTRGVEHETEPARQRPCPSVSSGPANASSIQPRVIVEGLRGRFDRDLPRSRLSPGRVPGRQRAWPATRRTGDHQRAGDLKRRQRKMLVPIALAPDCSSAGSRRVRSRRPSPATSRRAQLANAGTAGPWTAGGERSRSMLRLEQRGQGPGDIKTRPKQAHCRPAPPLAPPSPRDWRPLHRSRLLRPGPPSSPAQAHDLITSPAFSPPAPPPNLPPSAMDSYTFSSCHGSISPQSSMTLSRLHHRLREAVHHHEGRRRHPDTLQRGAAGPQAATKPA